MGKVIDSQFEYMQHNETADGTLGSSIDLDKYNFFKSSLDFD